MLSFILLRINCSLQLSRRFQNLCVYMRDYKRARGAIFRGLTTTSSWGIPGPHAQGWVQLGLVVGGGSQQELVWGYNYQMRHDLSSQFTTGNSVAVFSLPQR